MKVNMYNIGNCIVGNSEVDLDNIQEISNILIDKYGESTMLEFVENFKAGQDYSDAFKNALNKKHMIKKLKFKESI
ncbi:hypothetical protein BVF91_03570 [Thermoanaerobacterium sp. PSU-2]|uniref:hypothetical protein n=1 Tax=Thermoanaerobacterium sp. PSU-2 TaxID=1930849 RepID=UPI000A15D792|nr:hypothetical protein [Thermoanaerobacterium sp. PSU-2]ORX23987.1 hypothetical protein BVF91_03570 [Thermoanaerobacterium sp. PSU-2]HHV73456.1 hypothetical protein [Thermoanaerobacterium sp.]